MATRHPHYRPRFIPSSIIQTVHDTNYNRKNAAPIAAATKPELAILTAPPVLAVVVALAEVVAVPVLVEDAVVLSVELPDSLAEEPEVVDEVLFP